MANAWARLAADVSDVNAALILKKELGAPIPKDIIEAGLLQKRDSPILASIFRNKYASNQ